MKPSDFIKENSTLLADVSEMDRDHEVQMAREACYNIATHAIELHKLLKQISEAEGIDGWVSEKITLANDYVRNVLEYIKYESFEEQRLGEDASAGSSSSASIAAAPAPNLFKKKMIKRKK